MFFLLPESLRGVFISFFRATCTATCIAGTSSASIAGTAGNASLNAFTKALGSYSLGFADGGNSMDITSECLGRMHNSGWHLRWGIGKTSPTFSTTDTRHYDN